MDRTVEPTGTTTRYVYDDATGKPERLLEEIIETPPGGLTIINCVPPNYEENADPERWVRNVATFSSIQYEQLYTGVSLHYGGDQKLLKGTYRVAPGADPLQIRWSYVGARSVRTDAKTGELCIDGVSI